MGRYGKSRPSLESRNLKTLALNHDHFKSTITGGASPVLVHFWAVVAPSRRRLAELEAGSGCGK